MKQQSSWRHCAAIVTLVWAALAVNAATAVEIPVLAEMSEAELAAGQKLFRTHCGRCHGMLGDGGEGPSLKRAVLRYAPDDASLFSVIDRGLPGTGMPGTFGPNEDELWQIAGFVRSLGRLPEEALPGDPSVGKRLYEQKGACGTCHILEGNGTGVGPELSQVGLRRNSEYLRRSLTNPDADHPMKIGYMTGRINAFLTVQVANSDGEFEGMRVNEDEFTIQMRDLSGNIMSFDKRELMSFKKAFGHSLMPGYSTVFSEAEVNDLVAYLMTLKGET